MKTATDTTTIRPIRPADIGQVAQLIRTVMTEFGCVGEGYSIEDPEVDDMFTAYQGDRAAFFVITDPGDENCILGCGGIAPLAGADGSVCELKKMYFYPGLRGHGMGRRLVETCLHAARQAGYRQCYLETVARMVAANHLYQKMGFAKINASVGNTGHCSCDSYYVRDCQLAFQRLEKNE